MDNFTEVAARVVALGDEATMTAQAERLTKIDHQHLLAQSNVAPREGFTPTPFTPTALSEYVDRLFDR